MNGSDSIAKILGNIEDDTDGSDNFAKLAGQRAAMHKRN
jgi:hypothetical protein